MSLYSFMGAPRVVGPHRGPGLDSHRAPPGRSRLRQRCRGVRRVRQGQITVKVGIPSEVKNNEFRVGITPVGVHELVRRGHDVFVQKGAGLGSSITDEEYVSQGATILDAADDVWGESDMVMKVKEPVAEEYHRLREGLTLFTYLHLAADEPLTKELVATQGHLHRLRDGAAALGPAAAALPDVRGRGLPGPPGRRALDDEGPGRPRRAHGRHRRRRELQGRRHRRRRRRPERREHRARHGRRRHPARHRPRQAADELLALRQPGRPDRLVGDVDQGAGARRRPRHRHRAHPRRQGPQARHRRDGRRR